MQDVKESFNELINVMLELRAKCPWDQKQTNETLRYLTLEECYELSDAIVSKKTSNIKEELGDILLHVVFYSIIATEAKQFTLNDVIQEQIKKLIDRHPHIYGDTKVRGVKDVKKNWELLKLKENSKKTILSGVPKSLPSMLKSYRIQEKVKGVGFDFKSNDESFNKVIEEINEFKIELKNKDIKKASEEFGDILFSLIGYAQRLGINSVNALEYANNKFIHRFTQMEKEISKNQANISDYSSDELNTFWNQVKD